jgi:hypothetical protein
MKKTLFSLAALMALTFAGCSKDDDGGGQEKTILGKWTMVSTTVAVTDVQNGGTKKSEKPVYSGDYLDFRSDGKIYSRISDPLEGPGYDPHDTVAYRMTTTYLIIDNDSMLINKLTKEELAFTLQEKTSSEIWETTFSLKK